MRKPWIVSNIFCAGLLVAFAAAAQVGGQSPNQLGAPTTGQTSPPSAPDPVAAPPTAAPPAAALKSAEVSSDATTAANPDEAAIRRVVDAFTKAYDAGDAKSIAGLFLPDAEIVSEDGTTVQGREAIENDFSGTFKDHPKATIKSDVKSIRFVSPTMAIEEGSSIVMHDPDQAAEHTRYEVVHVKQAGVWLMASARDLPDDEASGQDQLSQLRWLIGDWVDEDPEALVHTSYRWAADHHFVLCDFTVNLNGQMAMSGTQRIGWDPLAKTIRSWSFDSEGGFTEAVWTREGNQWIIKTTGVSSDGKAASSTSYLTRMHKHRLTWESKDRFVGGEKMADIGPIMIARQAPAPGEVKKHATSKQPQTSK